MIPCRLHLVPGEPIGVSCDTDQPGVARLFRSIIRNVARVLAARKLRALLRIKLSNFDIRFVPALAAWTAQSLAVEEKNEIRTE